MNRQEMEIISEMVVSKMKSYIDQAIDKAIDKASNVNNDDRRNVGIEEASKILGRSKSWIKLHLDEIPHRQDGKHALISFIPAELYKFNMNH